MVYPTTKSGYMVCRSTTETCLPTPSASYGSCDAGLEVRPVYIGGGATIWRQLNGGTSAEHRARRRLGIYGIRRFIGFPTQDTGGGGYGAFLQRAWNAIMHAITGNRNPRDVKVGLVVEKPKAAKKKGPRAVPKKKPADLSRVLRAPRKTIVGHGDYEMGKNIGGKIGSWLGGKVHSWISSIFGSGDYDVVTPEEGVRGNSLLAGDTIPQFAGARDGKVRFGFSEFLGYLPVNQNFTVATYNLDVSSRATFPWSHPMARMYQQYIIHGMLFLVKSNMSQLTTAASIGTIFGSVRYDVDSKQPTSKSEVMNSLFAASARASGNLVFPVECNPKQTIVWPLKVRQPGVTTGDEQLYSMGKIDICSEGAPTSAAKGMEVTVVYDIEFLKPRLNISGGSVTLFADLAGNDNTNILKTISSTPLVPQPRINTLGVSLTGGGAFTLPYDVEVGTVYHLTIAFGMNPSGVTIQLGGLTHLELVAFTGNQSVFTSQSGSAPAGVAPLWSNMMECALRVTGGASALSPPGGKFVYVGALASFGPGHLWIQEADPRVGSGLTAVDPVYMNRREFVAMLDNLAEGDAKSCPLDFDNTRLVDFVEAFRQEPIVDVTTVPRSAELYDLGLSAAIDRMAVYRRGAPISTGFVDLSSEGRGRGSRGNGRLNGARGEYTNGDDLEDVEPWVAPLEEPPYIWWAGDIGPMPLAPGGPDGEVTQEEYEDMQDDEDDPPSSPSDIRFEFSRLRPEGGLCAWWALMIAGMCRDAGVTVSDVPDFERSPANSVLLANLAGLLPTPWLTTPVNELRGHVVQVFEVPHPGPPEFTLPYGFVNPERAPSLWRPDAFSLRRVESRRRPYPFYEAAADYCEALYNRDCDHAFWVCPGTTILLCELIGCLLRERPSLNGAQGSYTGSDDVVRLGGECGAEDCANSHYHKEERQRAGRTAKPGAAQRIARRKAVDRWLLCVDKDGAPLHSCNCEWMDIPHRHVEGERVTKCPGCVFGDRPACATDGNRPCLQPFKRQGEAAPPRVPDASSNVGCGPQGTPPGVPGAPGARAEPSAAPPQVRAEAPRASEVAPPQVSAPRQPGAAELFAPAHRHLAARFRLPPIVGVDPELIPLLLEVRKSMLHYLLLTFFRDSPPAMLAETKAEVVGRPRQIVVATYHRMLHDVAIGGGGLLALAHCGWDLVRALHRDDDYDLMRDIAGTEAAYNTACAAYNRAQEPPTAAQTRADDPAAAPPDVRRDPFAGVDAEVRGWWEAEEAAPPAAPAAPAAPAPTIPVVAQGFVIDNSADARLTRHAARTYSHLPRVPRLPVIRPYEVAHRVLNAIEDHVAPAHVPFGPADLPGFALARRRLYTVIPSRRPGFLRRCFEAACAIVPGVVGRGVVDVGAETKVLETTSVHGNSFALWCRSDSAIDAGPDLGTVRAGKRVTAGLPAEYGSYQEVDVFIALFEGMTDLADVDVKELNARKIILGEEGMTRIQSTLMQSIKRFAANKNFRGVPFAEYRRRNEFMEHVTLLCVAQWFIARAYLESMCTPTHMRPPAFPKGAACGTVEHRGPIRVYGLVATTVKPFLWNGRFEVTKGREFFDNGELRFPTPERDVDGNYKTLFGPVFACDWAIFRRCNANMSLALRRLTCNRNVANPNEDDELAERQALFITANNEFYDSLITLYAPFLESLNDRYTEEECHYDDPHPKLALRVSGHKDMRHEAVVTRRCWNRKAYNDGVFKLEKAKSGGKYPRFVVSLGVEASLLGFRCAAALKEAMASTVIRVNGGEIHFCKSPVSESLDRFFTLLIECPGRFIFVFFSDDSCYATRQRGVLEWFNVDISGCDASHRDCMFRLLARLAGEHEKWFLDLVAQCEMPVRIKDVADTRMKPNFVELRPIGAFMYSGSTLTTLMANLASISLALSFSSAADGPCDFQELAAAVGYRVTGMERSLRLPEELQFLKHSPCLDRSGDYRSMLNLGVFLRASGMCDGDLPGPKGNLASRARTFQANLIQGAYTNVHFGFIDQMRLLSSTPTERAAYFVEKTHAHVSPVFFDDDSICRRYSIALSDYAELCELSRHQYGYHISCRASLAILNLDYGLGPEERSDINYFFDSGRGD